MVLVWDPSNTCGLFNGVLLVDFPVDFFCCWAMGVVPCAESGKDGVVTANDVAEVVECG